MFNKVLSIIISIVLILSMSCTAFAENISEEPSQNVMRPIKINSELLKKYMPFAANLPNDENCLNILMNAVTAVKDYTQNDHAVVEYVPSGISNYFDYCETDDDMQSITSIDGALYVSYIHEDYEISLRYAEDGLSQLVVYDNVSDTAFIKQENEYYLETGFRYGDSEENAKDKEEINGSLDNYQTIDNTNNHNIFNSSYSVSTSNSGVKGFSDVSQLLNDLKDSFPELHNYFRYSESRYISYLGRNVWVKVCDSRDTYTYKTVSNCFRDWGINVAITAICAYLGIPNPSVVANILTVLNVGISTVGTITTAVRTYRSAAFSYRGERYGSVFDTTTRNAYVKTMNYVSSGEFHGGYNSNGEWTWIDYISSTAYSHLEGDIAYLAGYYYNADLILNDGVCTYSPE